MPRGNTFSPIAGLLAPLAGIGKGMVARREYDDERGDKNRAFQLQEGQAQRLSAAEARAQQTFDAGQQQTARRRQALEAARRKIANGGQLTQEDLVGLATEDVNLSGLGTSLKALDELGPYNPETDRPWQRKRHELDFLRENHGGPFKPGAGGKANGIPAGLVTSPYIRAGQIFAGRQRAAAENGTPFDTKKEYAESVQTAFTQSPWGSLDAYNTWVQSTYGVEGENPYDNMPAQGGWEYGDDWHPPMAPPAGGGGGTGDEEGAQDYEPGADPEDADAAGAENLAPGTTAPPSAPPAAGGGQDEIAMARQLVTGLSKPEATAKLLEAGFTRPEITRILAGVKAPVGRGAGGRF